MRSISGGRNRLVLIVAGLLALLAAAWLLASALNLITQVPVLEPALGRSNTMVADLAATHQAWLLPAALALAVVLFLIGIALAIAQIPRRPATSRFRIADPDGQDLAGVEPAVLERAVRERLDGVSGISDATVIFAGSARSPRAQAEITVRDNADVSWVIDTARSQIAEDISTALGTSLTSLDLLVRLTTRSGSKTDHAELA